MAPRPADLARRVWRVLVGLTRFAPTRRLALVVLVASPVWLLSGSTMGDSVAALVSCAVVLAALFDALRIPGRGSLELTRAIPPRIPLGESRELTIEVRSRWPRVVLATVTQRATPTIRIEPRTTDAQALAPNGASIFHATITATARGVIPVGPLALTATGPWGLVRRSVIYSLSDTIDVI